MTEAGSSPDTTPRVENLYYDMEQAQDMRANLERALFDKGILRKVSQQVEASTYDGKNSVSRHHLEVSPDFKKALKEPSLALQSTGIKDVWVDTDNSGEPVVRISWGPSLDQRSTAVVEFTGTNLYKYGKNRINRVGFYHPDIKGSTTYFSWSTDKSPADYTYDNKGKWVKIEPEASKVLDKVKHLPSFKPSLGQRVAGVFRR